MPITRTVKVIVRHAADCKDRGKGSNWRHCNCWKSLLVYNGELKKNQRVRTHNRDWEEAEKQAQELRDSWDPVKVELKRLRAEKERKQVPIEAAIGLYIQDQITQHGDSGTVAMVRSLFGNVDPGTNEIKPNGRQRKRSRASHLLDWIKTLPVSDRPLYIADITPTHLTQWRASWKFNDLTAKQRWSMVKGFFSFCESQDWIADSPARKLKPLKADSGNRTAIFTDEQYTAIHDSILGSAPENVPVATRKNWEQRLETFLELLRWSGMDLVDAVQWSPNLMDADGVLRYHRQKTGVLATVPLPEHVATLLRDVPLERDSVGKSHPFRTNAELQSDVRCWQHRLENLFKLAGIKEVQTKLRKRDPHCKMLRDTFAVGELKKGVPIYSVSKMLGHANTKTTEKAYLPWVKELEAAHIETVRKYQKQSERQSRKLLQIGSR